MLLSLQWCDLLPDEVKFGTEESTKSRSSVSYLTPSLWATKKTKFYEIPVAMCPLQNFNTISRSYGQLLRAWLFQFEGFAWHSRVTELNLVGVLLASLT